MKKELEIKNRMESIVTENNVIEAKAKIQNALATMKERNLELIVTSYVDASYQGPMYKYFSYLGNATYYMAFDPLNLFEKPKAKRGEESQGYISIKIKKIEDIVIMLNGREIK